MSGEFNSLSYVIITKDSVHGEHDHYYIVQK